VTFGEYTAAHESFRLAAANGVDAAVLHRVMTENGNLTPSMTAFIDSRTSGPARLGQAEFAEARTRIGKLSENGLDVALDLAHDSGLILAATERVRALILEVFENKSD
jgi:3-hydroxyisobutyrate dehydrogenase